MSVVLLRRRKASTYAPGRPDQCPYCGSGLFQRWGEVKKPVKDQNLTYVSVYRYRCDICHRTFRNYPGGLDRSNYTVGTKQIAALIWAFGYSYRDITTLFQKYEITLSRSTVWREGQELAAKLGEKKLKSHREIYTIDKEYIHKVSSRFGVVVAVDVGNGRYAIIGTLNEDNPQEVQRWLSPLIKDAEVEVLQLKTGKLDLLYRSENINTEQLMA